jgi:hypothetical protein
LQDSSESEVDVDHWWILFKSLDRDNRELASEYQHISKASDIRWSLCGIWVGLGFWTRAMTREEVALEKCPKCLEIAGYMEKRVQD